ncbi:zinc ribbon domain-containing protein [Haloimpatiens sp. FM7330]|uniref:zinc ribbon domain-containing protein n=1 Tax=Haloimpatiens sp. FM7330 TaxID=3298610 RepID=UPI00363CF6C2
MKFCTKCGTELEEGQSVCPKCGYNLNQRKSEIKEEDTNNKSFTDASEEKNVNANEDEYVDESAKYSCRFSKKFKISLIGIAVIAALLITFFVVENSLSKPSKTVLKFEKAIKSNNQTEVSNMLCCEESRLKIDKNNISSMMLYLKQNPSKLKAAIQDLKNEAIKIEKFKDMNVFNRKDSKNIFNVELVDKKLGFFPIYKINIKPTFIKVNAGIKGVEFLLDNKKIGKSDVDNFSKKFGPFIPGKYKLLAKYKGKYTSLSENYDIDTINSENDTVSINVLKNLSYIKVESEYPEAKIFVDGRDTGITIKNAKNFGPLKKDAKVYAIIKKGGHNLKSNECTVDQSENSIYLDFSEAEAKMDNAMEQLTELMNNYTEYFTEAVNMDDFSLVEPYMYPGSKLYNDQIKYIHNTYEEGISEYVMSLRVLSYNLSQDNKSGTVVTQEVYRIDKDGDSSVKSFKYKYGFLYNELTGSYQLQSIAKAK